MKNNDINNTLTIDEMIEDQMLREGMKPKPVKAIEAPVVAESHTAIYKMQRYWARRPYNVFAKLIQHYSNPGDIILDPFCGGGVTIVEGLKHRRRVIGFDLNPLAIWITKNEIEKVDLVKLKSLYEEWYNWVVKNVSKLFITQCRKCSKEVKADWFEWSKVVLCPYCRTEVILGNAQKINKPFQAIYECTNPKCRAKLKPSKLSLCQDRIINVKYSCDECEIEEITEPIEYDFSKYNNIQDQEKNIIKKEQLFIPEDKFPDMDRARDDNIFGKGIYYFRDLFSARQRIALGITRKWLEKCDLNRNGSLFNSLLALFTTTLRFVNKMTIRSQAWRGTNPLEWAGHMYWNPFTYLETSCEYPLKKRFKSIYNGKEEVEKEINHYYRKPFSNYPWKDIENKSTAWLLNQSSENIPMPDESVDAVITDPPYGGNVQYLELSDFYLVWLKDLVPFGGISNKDKEAIQTRHQGFEGAKDSDHYENMLYKIFRECRRVLKPDGWMVMTFHNRDIGVWTSLHRAAQRAGFKMPSYQESPNRGLMYQPAIKNYTQTIHQRLSGSLLGDFIVSFMPTDPPNDIAVVRRNLTLEEEKMLQAKSEEIIRYLGGANEDELWTRLIPHLSETGILARVMDFDFRQLLANKPFKYVKAEKKWFMEDMLEKNHLRLLDHIPVEILTQSIVYSYLREKKHATIDDLLIAIYTKLVNAEMPGLKNINNVLQKYCRKQKVKGKSRDYYVWDAAKKTPQDIERLRSKQIKMELDVQLLLDHNAILISISKSAIAAGYEIHAGKTEQRKSTILSNLSMNITGFDIGFSLDTFNVIKEIDLLILKNNNIQAGIEVVTTITTLNKAINDRFRNLLTLAPNLRIPLYIIIKDEDLNRAESELSTPANIESGLNKKVEIVRFSDLKPEDLLDRFLKGNR